jgi:hypothetical protein
VGWRNVAYGNIYYAENRSGISASMSLVSRGWGHVYFQKKKMKKELIKGIFVDQRKVKCYSEQDEWRATVEPPFFMQCETDPRKITPEDLFLLYFACQKCQYMQLY